MYIYIDIYIYPSPPSPCPPLYRVPRPRPLPSLSKKSLPQIEPRQSRQAGECLRHRRPPVGAQTVGPEKREGEAGEIRVKESLIVKRNHKLKNGNKEFELKK